MATVKRNATAEQLRSAIKLASENVTLANMVGDTDGASYYTHLLTQLRSALANK